MKNKLTVNFDDFLIYNRNKINGYFNIVLCICLAVGPFSALGLKFGIFRYI